MAHELWPKGAAGPLPKDEIIRRMQESFAHVTLDVERASRHLEESVRHMTRIGGPHYTQEDIEHERRMIGHAVFVELADAPDSDLAYLSFVLEPDGEKIFISYESGEHEDASRGLLRRLSRVLDYDVDVV
jgi:hypothetical protein